MIIVRRSPAASRSGGADAGAGTSIPHPLDPSERAMTAVIPSFLMIRAPRKVGLRDPMELRLHMVDVPRPRRSIVPAELTSECRDRQTRPAGKERDPAQRRDRAQPAHTCQSQNVQAPGEDQDPRDEEP